MSGGVDSSLAAKLVMEQGMQCIGCTMKLYSNEMVLQEQSHTCCSLSDVEDAKSIAYHLGMPYYVFNFVEDFKAKVIQKFVDSYERGETPNPCIDCNRYMKFDSLYKRAEILGCQYIVTGHYARIEKINNQYYLKKALDENKDQSYVLYSLTQEQLAHTLFPLGELKKSEVRTIAEESGFVNAYKPDSQDICFVPNGDYSCVFEKYSEKRICRGNFVDKKGNILGEHKGIVHYTIGQRHGLGISAPEPLYVCRINPKTNEVVLGSEKDLYTTNAYVKDINWINGKPNAEFRCQVKVRYRQKEQWATVIPMNRNEVQIVFDEEQRAVTAGQAAVFYNKDIVLGGGTIQSQNSSFPDV